MVELDDLVQKVQRVLMGQEAVLDSKELLALMARLVDQAPRENKALEAIRDPQVKAVD